MTHPGRVMTIPGSGREVWVRVEDLSEWEKQGYVFADRGPALTPDDAGDESPPESSSAQAADSSPSGSAPAAVSEFDAPPQESKAEEQEPKPAVKYPRSRGRNTKPRA